MVTTSAACEPSIIRLKSVMQSTIKVSGRVVCARVSVALVNGGQNTIACTVSCLHYFGATLPQFRMFIKLNPDRKCTAYTFFQSISLPTVFYQSNHVISVLFMRYSLFKTLYFRSVFPRNLKRFQMSFGIL